MTLTHAGVPSGGDPSHMVKKGTLESAGHWYRKVQLSVNVTRHEVRQTLAGDCGPDVRNGGYRGPGYGVQDNVINIDFGCEGVFHVCGVVGGFYFYDLKDFS